MSEVQFSGREEEPEAMDSLVDAFLSDGLDSATRTALEDRLARAEPALLAALARGQEALALLAMGLEPIPPEPEGLERLLEALAGEAVPPPGVDSPRSPGAEAAMPGGAGLNPSSMQPDADLQELLRLGQRMARHASGRPAVPEIRRRRALLVIDMLHDYVDEDAPMEIPLARTVVPSIARRIAEERAAGTAIIYINDRHREDDPDFEVWPVHAVRGTRGAQVLPALRPAAGDLEFDRISYSAFFETGLEVTLTRLGITDLVLTGQAADACVLMTAVDGLMRGFHIEVPEDCVAGTTPEGKVFALRRLALLKPYRARRQGSR